MRAMEMSAVVSDLDVISSLSQLRSCRHALAPCAKRFFTLRFVFFKGMLGEGLSMQYPFFASMKLNNVHFLRNSDLASEGLVEGLSGC